MYSNLLINIFETTAVFYWDVNLMRAYELGIYDPAFDRSANREIADTRKPRVSLRDLNREKRIQRARAVQHQREEQTIALIFGNGDIEKEELDLRKKRADVRKAECDIEKSRWDIEKLKAEVIATMADAKKSFAAAKAENR